MRLPHSCGSPYSGTSNRATTPYMANENEQNKSQRVSFTHPTKCIFFDQRFLTANALKNKWRGAGLGIRAHKVSYTWSQP